jgi:tetratricopeptide (TPR) repeat protein
VGCVIVLTAALAVAAGPPGVPTEEQRRERGRGVAALKKAGELSDMGKLKEAARLAEEGLAAVRRYYGERHVGTAWAMEQLARVKQDMGDDRAALGLRVKALAVLKDVQGERGAAYHRSLFALGALHASMGDHGKALPLMRRALSLMKEADERRGGHPDQRPYLIVLEGLAGLLRDMGDYKEALPLMRRAVALHKALAPRHPDHARGLTALAALLVDLGDVKAAVPHLEEAVKIFRAALGDRHPLTLKAMEQLAEVKRMADGPTAALPLYEKALKLRKEVLGEGHPETAASLNNLAVLYQNEGRPEKALPLLKKSLGVYREALGERHPAYTTGLTNLASVYMDLGRPGAALPFAEQALALARTQLELNSAVQSERQQYAAMQALRHQLDMRLSMPDEAARFSHDHVLAWKGAAFRAQQGRRAFVRAESDGEAGKAAKQLQDAARSLAALHSQRGKVSLSRLDELEREKEDLEAELARLSAELRLARKPPTDKDTRASLPAGAALIDFLTYTGLDPARGAKGEKPERRLAAWVVRRDAATVRIDLGPVKPIKEAAAAWRKGMASDGERDAARRLRLLAWAPVERHVKGAKHLLISPDGPLNAVPFAALPGARAGSYLIEEFLVTTLPSPGLPDPRPGKAAAMLAVSSGTVAARGEARAARDGFLPDRAVIALDGRAATRQAVGEALAKVTHAHIAVPGLFLPAEAKGIVGWSPALRTGFTLADGRLTALEVAEIPLPNLDLAVLSGRDTALGVEAAGEGILGLPRALHLAGCRCVIASLWDTPEADGAVLMGRFHRNLWERKLPRGEALRQAQLSLLRERKGPRSWASWVLSGDWR